MCPLHGAHQYLRLWTSGEGEEKSHIMKKELSFTGLLRCAKNYAGCSHDSREHTAPVGQELLSPILQKRKPRLRGTERLVVLPKVTQLLTWRSGS